jgi:hypothetical protein
MSRGFDQPLDIQPLDIGVRELLALPISEKCRLPIFN